MQRTLRLGLLSLSLFALVGALYARTLSFEFVWDDAFQIEDNQAVTAGVPLRRYFLDKSTTTSRPDFNSRIYRPLRNIAFRGLAVGFGVRPFVYRAATLVVYGLCAVLIFLWLFKLTKSEWAAFVGATLWALLPIHVEVAAYASALGDSLSLALTLCALLAVGQTVAAKPKPNDPCVPPPNSARALWLLGSLICGLAAMAAKEMAITLPALVALVILFFYQWDKFATATVFLHTVVAGLFMALRTVVIGRVGQEDTNWQTLVNGLLLAPVALVHYVASMLSPLGHQPSYLQPELHVLRFAAMTALIAGVLSLTWWLERRRPSKLGFFGLCFLIVSLSPVLHLVPVWVFIADRFALTPSVGIAFVAASLAASKHERLRQLWPALALIGIIYASGTLLEQSKWRNNLSLFTHDVQAVPESPMAQSNYCTMMLKIGDPEQAVRACAHTLDLGRTTVDVLVRLGAAYEALERYDEATAAIQKAIVLDPKSSAAQAALGNIQLNRGNLVDAEGSLQHARRLGESPNMLILEGRIATARGDREQAFAAFDKLLLTAGRAARIRYLYAEAAHSLGDSARARREADACLALEPNADPCQQLLGKLGATSTAGPEKR